MNKIPQDSRDTIRLMDDITEILKFECWKGDYPHNAQYIRYQGDIYKRSYWGNGEASYQKCKGIYHVEDLNPIAEEPIL